MFDDTDRIEALVDRTIVGIRRDADGEVLVLDTDAGPVSLRTEGDCCSHSYWQHAASVGAVLGQVVTRTVEREELVEDDGETKLCGYEIHTAKGTLVLELRNDSNGYYGGWCVVTQDDDTRATAVVVEDF